MKLVVNIEYPVGIDMSSEHIGMLAKKLGVKMDDVTLIRNYNGAWFWFIDNVSDKLYSDAIKSIAQDFNKMYSSGYIHYFYIGEYR